MTFCEASRCALIAQPANTWSSFGFVLVGGMIMREGRTPKLWHAIPFGIAAIAVGLGSAAYHATNAYIPEMIDLTSMFWVAALMIVINVRRIWSPPAWILALVFAVITSLVLGATIIDIDYGNSLFGAELVAAGALEALLWRRDKRLRRYLWVVGAIGCFAVGYTLWTLDYYHVICDPRNGLINGHAVWHLATAGSLYCLHRFYRDETLRDAAMAPA
jgi:hypothetical protein